MSNPFSRSLRALESQGSRGWLAAVAGVALLLTAWAAWFVFAQVPLYETSNVARVESVAAAHPVDARLDGRVVRVQLSVGAPVRAGDVLVEIEADAERLALDEARARLNALGPEEAAARQEIDAEARAIADDRRALSVVLDEQRAITREAQAALRLADEEASRTARLRADGLVAELEDIRVRAEAERKRAAAEAASAALDRMDRDQTTRESDRLVRVQRLRGTLSRLDGEAATAAATIKRLQYEVERRVFRAPVGGRIAEAADLRVGAVVKEGERLAAIVPEGALRIVAQFAPASAIGRVRPGQQARLRLLAFPWVEYGSLRARVTEVADEVRGGFVRVELAVDTAPPSVSISHALPGSVEIEVERVSPVWLILRTLGAGLTRVQGARPASAS
jgi:multidrug resistance efflux pump